MFDSVYCQSSWITPTPSLFIVGSSSSCGMATCYATTLPGPQYAGGSQGAWYPKGPVCIPLHPLWLGALSFPLGFGQSHHTLHLFSSGPDALLLNTNNIGVGSFSTQLRTSLNRFHFNEMKWSLNLSGNVWNQQRVVNTSLGKWKTIVYDFMFFTPRGHSGIIVKNRVFKPANNRTALYSLWMRLPLGELKLSFLFCQLEKLFTVSSFCFLTPTP